MNYVKFTDDILLVSDSLDELQEMENDQNRKNQKVDFKINKVIFELWCSEKDSKNRGWGTGKVQVYVCLEQVWYYERKIIKMK